MRTLQFIAGRYVVMIALLLACTLSAFAEGTAPAHPLYQLNRADEDYRYLKTPASRTDIWDRVKYLQLNEAGSWYLSLGGEARERFEYFNNPNWGKDPQDNGYFLQRYFLHADLHLGEQVRIFSQLQSSLEDGRTGGARPTDKDELDLHQAFLDLKLDFPADGSLTLRSGRQELIYGSQRIISVREGPNVRQSFDGFRGMLRIGDLRLDGFATRPAETKRHVFDDGTDNNRVLWGLYSVFPFLPLPKGNIDLYYVGVYNGQARFDQGTARETRHSLGGRLWRSAKPFDYNFEAIYQWGSFGNGNIQAWTVASDTGYSVESLPFRPRFGLKADIASGDENRNNPDLQTFNPLFPKGAYFSEDNLIGPANFINLNPSLGLYLTDHLALTLDWDFFWRESNNDGVYNNAVVLVRSAGSSNSRFIGNQGQLQLEWTPDRHISVVGIYAHFFAGPFIKETGPGKDVDYLTSWLSYKF